MALKEFWIKNDLDESNWGKRGKRKFGFKEYLGKKKQRWIRKI